MRTKNKIMINRCLVNQKIKNVLANDGVNINHIKTPLVNKVVNNKNHLTTLNFDNIDIDT